MQPEAGATMMETDKKMRRIGSSQWQALVKVGGARFDFDAAGCPETARRLG